MAIDLNPDQNTLPDSDKGSLNEGVSIIVEKKQDKQPEQISDAELDDVTGGLFSTCPAGTETFKLGAKSKISNSPLNLETKFEDE